MRLRFPLAALCLLAPALVRHQIKHEYHVGGYTAHDWATWRHLLHERFLPNLWRKP